MRPSRPIIASTVYRKSIPQRRPIDVYGLMPSYSEAISKAGGIPLLIPLGLSEDDLTIIMERVDGVILPGGGDVAPERYNGRGHESVYGVDLERDRTELFVARAAVTRQKPFLAICRGIQVLNVALGGTLWYDICSQVPDAIDHDASDDRPRNHLAHVVAVRRHSLLAKHMGKQESWVNSYHHQAIRELAPDLEVTATAPDGVIEAVELAEHPFAVGVQWHPENLVHDDTGMHGLFAGLVKAAERSASRQPAATVS
ncbi:MAG: gamma-glutamyl-gamma-aminobutyrate hydrolase family protein [Chloroflexota bacterium]|nr:MAG: gamma-glutamyl-gamma-aminobutyrate hydrolase family protein [Chloroflexota bacterium]